MRTTYFTRAMAPLACAALMVACGGTDGANSDRPAQSGHSPLAAQQLRLTGCVQTGPAGSDFVLQNVQLEDVNAPTDTAATGNTSRRADAPQATATAGNAASVITEGSWVPLRRTGTADPGQFIGQEVKVTGRLVAGQPDSIGTGGDKGAAGAHTTPSGDRSLAATDKGAAEKKREEAGPIGTETLANNRVPEIEAFNIEPTGQRCTGPKRDR